MPTSAALQFSQTRTAQKITFKDVKFYFPKLLALASHSPAHSSTQILQRLTSVLEAQALSWELGSKDGQSV